MSRLPGLKLASLGLSIDELTAAQKKYQCSWDIGNVNTVLPELFLVSSRIRIICLLFSQGDFQPFSFPAPAGYSQFPLFADNDQRSCDKKGNGKPELAAEGIGEDEKRGNAADKRGCRIDRPCPCRTHVPQGHDKEDEPEPKGEEPGKKCKDDQVCPGRGSPSTITRIAAMLPPKITLYSPIKSGE